MKKFLCILAVFVFFYFSYELLLSLYALPSEKEKIVQTIESKTAKILKQRLGLIPFGVGGQMMNQIQRLMLDFQYKHEVTVEEGRRLLVYSVLQFLDEINSNEVIRKYLQNFPFQPKNVEVCIFLVKPDGSTDFDFGDLEVLVAKEGKIQFKYNNSTYSRYRTHEETFEEACKILEEEKQKAM